MAATRWPTQPAPKASSATASSGFPASQGASISYSRGEIWFSFSTSAWMPCSASRSAAARAWFTSTP